MPLVVAGKSFAFAKGDADAELEAFGRAREHLQELHEQAVKRLLPAPGSQRRAPRLYDEKGAYLPGHFLYKGPEKAPRKAARKGNSVTLAPKAAVIKRKAP